MTQKQTPAAESAHHNIPAAPGKDFPDIANPGADGVSYFTPVQDPVAGTGLSENPPALFRPLTIRGVTFQNRLFLAPLCQYSAKDGVVTPWHQSWIGSVVIRGAGLSFIEGTSVTPEGRITPQDSGLWNDEQAAALRPIVEFAHSQGQRIGIQLAHAGRKASTVAPWISGKDTSSRKVGGWPDAVIGPSASAYSEDLPDPRPMTLADIRDYKAAFLASVRRALAVGFDVLEIHAAHGYLLHEFLSPVSNQRTDQYGGSFENRTRLLRELVDEIRAAIPDSVPLFLRVSATDWLEHIEGLASWRLEDTVELAKLVAGKVDLLDVSSGGNDPRQKMSPLGSAPGEAFQAGFSHKIKEAVGDKLLVSVVGGIKHGKVANELLERGLDVAFVGRQFQKNPGLVFAFADELDTDVQMPNQIAWPFKGRGSRGKK